MTPVCVGDPCSELQDGVNPATPIAKPSAAAPRPIACKNVKLDMLLT